MAEQFQLELELGFDVAEHVKAGDVFTGPDGSTTTFIGPDEPEEPKA